MTERPILSSCVLLKDGTMIPCTSQQKNRLGMAILTSPDLSKTQVRLGGRTFSLTELEDDANKIAQAQQTAMPLGETKTPEKKNYS